MFKIFGLKIAFVNVYENDVDSLIPEKWAYESIDILLENMVVANLVHRDFSDEIAEFGDVVNTRKPADFQAYRKIDSEEVTVQDAVAPNIQVPLNQHVHVSFRLKDGQESKSFKDLSQEFLFPAVKAEAAFLDMCLLGQYAQFIDNSAGRLGAMTTSTARDDLLDLRKVFNTNKVEMDGRHLIFNPTTEALMLKLDLFTQAQQVGDEGQALREATLGRKLGWNMYMCQNMATVAVGNTVVLGAVNNVAGYPAGTTTLTVDGFAAALPVNSYLTIAGDDTPQRIVSSVGGATPTSVTIYPGLKRAVLDNAVITRYVPGQINFAAGYAAGWHKELVVDTFTVAPQVGQLVTFGVGAPASSAVYTIVKVNGLVGITLDRPLVATLADNDPVNIGPAGQYNFAFVKNALALVNRPLAAPRPGTGALASVVNYGGMSMRVVITYDGAKQGHLITIDSLFGTAVLDAKRGGVLLG